MILKALKYTRFAHQPREWSLVGKESQTNNSFAYFSNLNLLVGKNASGKSRTLDVIRDIANLFADRLPVSNMLYATARFELIFEDKAQRYEYILDYKDRVVANEALVIDGEYYIDRLHGILAHPADKHPVSYDVSDNEILITAKEAGKYVFAPLVEWGNSLKDFLFSDQLEKSHLVKDYTVVDDGADTHDASFLVYTFHKGREEFGGHFVDEVKNGMKELGYPEISNIDIQQTKAGYGICVEEDGRYIVSQREMSQGMYRILSMLIHLVYVRLADKSICVLVDDVGEGLDYERSKGLIDIFIRKVSLSNIQFFITTNDRYVMNKVPLRYWNVIERDHSRSVLYNYENSKDVFDDFKYTGLNNFDFLTTDFYCKGFGTIDE